MEIELKHGRAEAVETDLLVVGMKAGDDYCAPLKRLNTIAKGEVGRELERRGFNGAAGSSVLLPTLGAIPARNVLVVGLGKDGGGDALRSLGDAAVNHGRAIRARTIAIAADDHASMVPFIVEGAALSSYRFTRFKTADNGSEPEQMWLLASSSNGKTSRAVEQGRRAASAVNLTRDLINLPAEDATPEFLAQTAREIAKREHLACEAYDRAGIERLKMGALLGVAKASPREPRFIVMTYKPARASNGHISLVGKGITFDSGGLNLKAAANMEVQKRDMTGAATLLGVMSQIAYFKPSVEVRAYMPCTENMISGTATKPGDVLWTRLGKTIEVLNTDAEGRLVLADALAYACEHHPDSVIDVGTLTAAVRVALGTRVGGIMGTDPKLISALIESGKDSGERLWELPLVQDYADELRSNVADLRNIGTSGDAGTIICGLFLSQFVNCKSWEHLDLSGVAFTQRALPLTPPGAVGFGVRTLLRFLTSRDS